MKYPLIITANAYIEARSEREAVELAKDIEKWITIKCSHVAFVKDPGKGIKVDVTNEGRTASLINDDLELCKACGNWAGYCTENPGMVSKKNDICPLFLPY